MINSEFHRAGVVPIPLPKFTGTRVMMMPVTIGQPQIPGLLHWGTALSDLYELAPEHIGQTGYLTIDEREVPAGTTHRRSGIHVDGVYRGAGGSWGGGGPWGANGMLTVSSVAGCRVWAGEFDGEPGPEGECDHIADQLGAGIVLNPHVAYWLSGTCIHESIPMATTTQRQFVRLSFPSHAPWFEGYTPSPLGVQPNGPILPARTQFMEVLGK